MKARDLHIDNLPFELGYDYPVKTIPPVAKTDTGWSVRIETGRSWGGGSTRINWDYFRTDEDGLVLSSPRGCAKEYNKRVRLTGLADWKQS